MALRRALGLRVSPKLAAAYPVVADPVPEAPATASAPTRGEGSDAHAAGRREAIVQTLKENDHLRERLGIVRTDFKPEYDVEKLIRVCVGRRADTDPTLGVDFEAEVEFVMETNRLTGGPGFSM